MKETILKFDSPTISNSLYLKQHMLCLKICLLERNVFTILQRDSEHSIVVWDPFSFPKALVAIPIEGVEQLPILEADPKDKTKVTYPLTIDEAEETTWQAIRSRVEERSNDNTLVRINLSDGVDAVSNKVLNRWLYW